MAILETIRENIGAAGQITADIARRTAESLKLRDQIRRDKKEIRKMIYGIGETYLRLHPEDYEEVYKEFVDGIAIARADIEEKKQQLVQLRPGTGAAQEEAESQVDDILEADEDSWDDLFEAGVEDAAAAVEDIAGTVEEAVGEIADELKGTAQEAEETAEETVEEAAEEAAAAVDEAEADEAADPAADEDEVEA